MQIWNTLGIAPTTDENAIRQACADAVGRLLACGSADEDRLYDCIASYFRALAAIRNKQVSELTGTVSPSHDRALHLALLFQRMYELTHIGADETAWLELTSSAPFLAFQDHPALYEWTCWLCDHLYPGMASALYTAYGFASQRALRLYPHGRALRDALCAYICLPVEDTLPLSQSDILRQTERTLEGILLLHDAPQSLPLWQQAFQTSDFLLLRYQPHFLLALGLFVSTHELSGECRLTLAQACTREMRSSPCSELLTAKLPCYAMSQPWPQPELFAGSLLSGDSSEFFNGARDKLLFLLARTAASFRTSSQRPPWDYVFAEAHFRLIKLDPLFLARLMAFSRNETLPLAFWQSLHDAYLEDFLKLSPDEGTPLAQLRDLARTNIMKGQPAAPKRRLRLKPPENLPVIEAACIAYLAAALWICFYKPLLGLSLLLLPVFLLLL